MDVGQRGWTVYVDANRNNFRDAGEAFATTNAQGHYTLDNLLATTTPVALEARSGLASSESREVTVTAGQSAASDFDIIATSPRIIHGRVMQDGSSKAVTGFAVYIDANSNGVRDAGESFSQTDRLGDYSLSGLSANNYVIRVDAPAGWSTVTPTSGKFNIDLTESATSTGNNFAMSATPAAASTPVFVTTAPAIATAHSQYRYAAVAVDPLARPVSYRLLTGPSLMSVDTSRGVIAWTPTASDIGSTRVILRATNDTGGVVIQDFSIVVAAANSAPIITSTGSSQHLWINSSVSTSSLRMRSKQDCISPLVQLRVAW